MVRRDLLCQGDGDGTASIIGFGPVKRDAEKCTAGTTRHAWIQIAHDSPVQLCTQKRSVIHYCTGPSQRQYFVMFAWCAPLQDAADRN